MTKNVAIVGSGFLGMTLALRLAETGAKVTIFEGADRIGGLTAAWEIGGFEWDKHYHVTLASDTFTRKIIEEIGLGDEFKWVETKTGFYTDGKLHSMSDTMEFLRFPPLGLFDRLRLAATILYASRQTDWRSLETIPVEDWLVKLSGKRTFEKIWRPLLMAKLGDSYKRTSAAFIWATIQRMFAARRSGRKKEMFGYVRGGYARVLRQFSETLMSKGVEIHLNSPIDRIEKLPNGSFRVLPRRSRRRGDEKKVVLRDGEVVVESTKYARVQTAAQVAPGFSGMFLSEPGLKSSVAVSPDAALAMREYDQVILTCPSSKAAEMLPQLTDDELAKLRNIEYQGIVCASVLMKCSLSPFYVTNITDEAPFTGVIEMTALVDKRDFGQNTLIYLPKYVAPDDELFEKTDAEVRESFFAALERMYPQFKRTDVIAFRVSRVRNVFPLPVLNYSDSLPDVRTSIENVFVVNSSQIVNGTLNVNETIQLAERFFNEELRK